MLLRVTFDEPVRAITGQAVVFYDEEVCLQVEQLSMMYLKQQVS